jgi:hypothetical protein
MRTVRLRLNNPHTMKHMCINLNPNRSSISSQLSPTYPCNPVTTVTYRFRIDPPHEDIGPVKDLENFLAQFLTDLCDGKDEDGFICPQRIL